MNSENQGCECCGGKNQKFRYASDEYCEECMNEIEEQQYFEEHFIGPQPHFLSMYTKDDLKFFVEDAFSKKDLKYLSPS